LLVGAAERHPIGVRFEHRRCSKTWTSAVPMSPVATKPVPVDRYGF